ncbi:tumor necrosis factor receptor superfamily member 18 [Molossus nigricans]|uniref:TNF receptor superfamily member 18 n=1 Tax=Molossus molossus TaxID=27622 RepID=A0A7J8B908_MOLMO|nr:tumor necrosis factor receptor superfamily member 18 [Molossus molossus]KAF6394959.1 TNF receptor superfamily member 18 [Molossus molossus]
MGAGVRRAALWGVVLLLPLGLGRCSPGGPSCAPGRRLLGTGTDARCCGSCAPEACPVGACECVQPEFHCGNPECTTCQHYPCPPGQGVKAHGKLLFGFECVDCAAGTFSGNREGRCKPWTECSQPGLRSVFPGNRTHDAVCSLVLPSTEMHCSLPILLLIVAACILALSVVHLGLHIWQLRRQRVWSPETQLLLEAPPPAEDACSCQFPEEERGEQLSEDKSQLGDL